MSIVFSPHKNLVTTVVQTAPSPATSGTSILLATGTGASFPSPSTKAYNVVIYPANVFPNASNSEIVTVTALSTDTMTVTRQAEGSIARSIQVGDNISLVATAQTFIDIENAINTVNASLTNITGSAITGLINSTSMPSFSGDVRTSPGSTVTTLATVNSNIGTFGDLSHIPVFTVNAKGLITGVTTAQITASSFFPDISDSAGVVGTTKLNYSTYIYNQGVLNMTRDLFGYYTLGTVGVRFKDNVGWQFYNTTTSLWYTLMCVGSTPSLAFGDGISATGFSNARFVDSLGWQFYNTTTQLWHTLLCIGSPPTVQFDDGTATSGITNNSRFSETLGWQFKNPTTGLWHTFICTGSSPSPAFDGGSA